jgi:hypothetical protein
MMLTTSFLFVAVTDAHPNEERINAVATVVSGLSIEYIKSAEESNSDSTDEMRFMLRGDHEIVVDLEAASEYNREYVTLHRDQIYTIAYTKLYTEITIQIVTY